MSPLSADVLGAIDRAAALLPTLAVIDTPDCDGYHWIADPATCTVRIRTAEPCQWSTYLLAALAALCGQAGLDSPRTLTGRPALVVLPGGGNRSNHREECTGTDDVSI